MIKYIPIAILLTSLSSYAGSLMCPTSVLIKGGGASSAVGPWNDEVSMTKTMSIWDCLRGDDFTYSYILDQASSIYIGKLGDSNRVNTYSTIPGEKTPISGGSSYIAELKFTAAGGNEIGYANYENNTVQSRGVANRGYGLKPWVDIKLRPFTTTKTLDGTFNVDLEDVWGYADSESNLARYIHNQLAITYTAINNHAVRVNFKDSQLACVATTGNICTAKTALNAVNSSDTETINAKLTFQTVSSGSYDIEIQGLGMQSIPIDQPIEYKIPPFGSMADDPLIMKIRGDTGSGIVTINAIITIS